MRRRVRRRLVVFGSAGLFAVSLPLWAPHLLATLPVFRVTRIEVVGPRYVPPDEVVRLAAIDSTASVWDDPSTWESRVRSHRLIREAKVHRRGLRTLEIRVVEDAPVALVATPALQPVDAEGRLLPLDPAEAHLDLPLLAGVVSVEGDRLPEGGYRVLAGVLGHLEEYAPAFTDEISEIGMLAGGGIDVRLLESAHCARVLLPIDHPILGLRRIELALGSAGQRARLADARFREQVVLQLERDPR